MSFELSAVGRATLPLGAPKSYMDAVERQQGQCGFQTKPSRMADKPRRCERYLNGGERLYLWGDALLCSTHYDKVRREARKR